MSRRKSEEHGAFPVQLLTGDRGDPNLWAPAGQDTSSTACFHITSSEANPQCPEIGMLTSPGHSSAAPAWISSPRFHNRCGFPAPPQAAVQCPALPVGKQRAILPQTHQCTPARPPNSSTQEQVHADTPQTHVIS